LNFSIGFVGAALAILLMNEPEPHPMSPRPPLWWDRAEPNLLLTPTRMARGAAVALGPGLETFPDFPLRALWMLALCRGLMPRAATLPERLPPVAARQWADSFEPLIPEVCWTEAASDAWDRTAAYFALLRAGHGVSIASGPDRTTAWLARTRDRRFA
jgi:hypothetical protein